MAATYQPVPKHRPKKQKKWIAFTALLLSTVAILSCAANTGNLKQCTQSFQHTLDELLLQYGANENYGLQSVARMDLWRDGTPELVVVRTLDETDYGSAATYLMIYDFSGGKAQLQLEKKLDSGADILWKRDENGLHFYGSTALTDKADHPGVQKLTVLTLQNDSWHGKTREYIQLNDGRWIDHGSSSYDEGRLLTDEENAALLKDTKRLLGRDWQGFLKKNSGTVCYQRAYLDILIHLQSIRKDPRYTSLVDFNGDGYPEMVTTANDKLYFYRYDPESGKADLVWGEELGCPYGEEDKRLFGINLTLERPALVVYYGPNPKSEFIEIYQWDQGAPIRRMPQCTLQARGDESGHRDNMHDWHSWYDDLTQGEYEERRLHYLQNAVLYDTRYHSSSISGNHYTDLREFHNCSAKLLTDTERSQPMEPSESYADVLRRLIAQYGLFDAGDGTLPVLGLKYAGLHRLSGDMPQLVTLVNNLDDRNILHMTLQVWNGNASLPVYSTELGAQYQQTDLSYRFAISDSSLLTWHSEQVWDEEILHEARGFANGPENVQVTVYEATGYAAATESDALPRCFIDGEEVSLGHHGHTVDAINHSAIEYDACWDVSPAGRAELMYLLDELGIDPDTIEPVVREETISVADGVLQIGAASYPLPDFIGASAPTVQQVGEQLLISAHWSPKHNYNVVFDLNTRMFGPPFWGLVLDWQADDLATLIYSQWNVLYQYPESAIGEFAQGMDLNGIRVEEAVIDEQWQTVTVIYTDVQLQEYREQFLLPDPATLRLAEQLNGHGAAQYLPFCETPGVLTVNEALAYARYLGELLGNDISQWQYSSCQAKRTPDGNTALTLLQPDWKSKRCLAQTHYLQKDGSFLTGEDHIADGYAGTQEAEWNGKALIAVRRSSGCLIMDSFCGYCFVIDLYLWDEPRQNSILVAEGLPLAIHFTAIEIAENSGILSLSYITGPAHSEYTSLVFAQVDMKDGTWLETGRQLLPQ